ncbi:hypothetical protein GCM10025782_20480 [Pedococcus ginsenosidimutans]|uniref:Uncharacterized protein n=1 Tax=Pedococcus ginsenosidimutans TaxID=490570 RepID=A0ABP8Y9F2_9MICO
MWTRWGEITYNGPTRLVHRGEGAGAGRRTPTVPTLTVLWHSKSVKFAFREGRLTVPSQADPSHTQGRVLAGQS